MRRRRVVITIAIGLVALASLVSWYLASVPRRAAPPSLGVTFSTKYAKELGLDWKEAYLATLDDLGVRHLRIPVYWDEAEPERGRYEWGEVEWMLDEAGERGAEVILAVGRKTPRWPECHVPGWAAKLDEARQRERVLNFLEAEILHFKSYSAVRVWQVENEPLFHFGKCPPPDRDFLKEEIMLVRGLDARPVMVTDSGELSTWIRTATLGDVLGISMYRLVWNKYLGELYWPVSPLYYTDRINIIGPVVKRVIVSELQAEPWFRAPVAETPIDEQFSQMDPERLRGNVEFAASTGASEIYLWGVEWWYWLKTNGRDELWKAARGLLS
ncbi:MAG: hypothetical protein AAB554_02465 [Patescibacteria group bacterium]